MLASILPGIRALRAPFAAGCLILASLYVLGYRHFQSAASRERLGSGLDSLLGHLGDKATTAVLGVAVYLVGTIFVAATRVLVSGKSMKLVVTVATKTYVTSPQTKWMSVVAPFSRASLKRVILAKWMSVVAPFSRASLERVILMCEREFQDPALAETVCSEIIRGGGKPLLVSHKDLYIEWDRLRAEAEFRDAVAGPGLLFAAVALTAVQWPVAGKVGVALAVVALAAGLWIHARRLDREANSNYAYAVIEGTVGTETLDDLRRDRAAATADSSTSSPAA